MAEEISGWVEVRRERRGSACLESEVGRGGERGEWANSVTVNTAHGIFGCERERYQNEVPQEPARPRCHP